MRPTLNIGIQAIRAGSRLILQTMDRLESMHNDPEKKQLSINKLIADVIYQIKEIIIKAQPKHEVQWTNFGDIDPLKSTWQIHPLAGFNNFKHDIPHFALQLCLVQDATTQIGIIYDPIRDELYTATLGQGAYMNQRRIRARSKPDGKAIIASYTQSSEVFGTETCHYYHSGCLALDLAYLAHGRYDGLLAPSQPLTLQRAGLLMLKEAGAIQKEISSYTFIAHSQQIERLL